MSSFETKSKWELQQKISDDAVNRIWQDQRWYIQYKWCKDLIMILIWWISGAVPDVESMARQQDLRWESKIISLFLIRHWRRCPHFLPFSTFNASILQKTQIGHTWNVVCSSDCHIIRELWLFGRECRWGSPGCCFEWRTSIMWSDWIKWI